MAYYLIFSKWHIELGSFLSLYFSRPKKKGQSRNTGTFCIACLCSIPFTRKKVNVANVIISLENGILDVAVTFDAGSFAIGFLEQTSHTQA